MKKIRTLLVDDEPIALRGMQAMLRGESDIEVVGLCQDGADAAAAILQLKPDLVLLDIQMPGMTGFDLVEAVGVRHMPPLIFVTAHDQHAVCAFDVQALDYVLKPVDPQRLRQALQRYRALHPQWPDKLVIKLNGRVVVADLGEVSHIAAAGNYVDVYRSGHPIMMRETLANLASTLDPARFVRISRSLLVNTSLIAEVRPALNGDFVVQMQDSTLLSGSRRFRAALAAMLRQ